MTTTMDIVISLDRSSSIAYCSDRIHSTVLWVCNRASACYPGGIRMALTEFQSHSDHWITNVHPFTSSMNLFQQWIYNGQSQGTGSDEDKAIADALSAALTLDWRPNNKIDRFHEKLMILITDGAPCGLLKDACPCNRHDLWQLADEFVNQDITLVVIGIEPSIVSYDDFYCALANKTGGEYLPLVNAERVLSSVIPRAILEEYTLSQLFRRLDIYHDIEYKSLYHYSAVQVRARYMIKYYRTMMDIRKQLFSCDQQSTEYVDNDDFMPHSPSENANYYINLLHPNANSFSALITDDEGYGTALSSPALNGSRSSDVLDSPVLLRRILQDCNSGIDDEYF